MPDATRILSTLADAGWREPADVRDGVVVLTPQSPVAVSAAWRAAILDAVARAGFTHVALEVPHPNDKS
jgi:hypothetical protein